MHNNYKLGCLLLLAVLFVTGVKAQDQQKSLLLTTAEQAWLYEHPVIPFAPDPGFPPVEFFDAQGHFSGITADYLSYISEMLLVEFKPLKPKSWSDTVRMVDSGEAYMFSAQLKTTANISRYEFSQTYLDFPMLILASKRSIKQQDYDDLDGKSLAVVADYPDLEIIREQHPDIELIEVKSVVAGLRLAAYGQVDAMIIAQPVASYYLEQEGITNLHVVGVAEYFTSISFAANKDYSILTGILNKALVAMPAEEKKRIHGHWILRSNNLVFDYTLLIRLLLSTLLVVLLIVWGVHSHYQRRRLNREITTRKLREHELNGVMERLKDANQNLELAVITDPLTGAMNRRGFFKRIETEHKRINRYGGDMVLLILDIDRFKLINDSYGHSAGDQALTTIVDLCKKLIRGTDVIARIGGEEFAILLPNTSLEESSTLAERIREMVENHTFDLENIASIKLTVSIGIASFEVGDTIESVMKKSDVALYRAKNKGRNQSACYQHHKRAVIL